MLISKKHTEKLLWDFVNDVVETSKQNLSKQGINASGDLSKSIIGDVDVFENSINVDILGEDYLKFVDKGVRGAGGVRKTTSKFNSRNNKGKLWKIKAKNSIYKFGKSGGISHKHFKDWARQKGLSPYAVAKAVYHQGIETTNFFTTPFEKAFERLPEDLVKAYALDLESFIEFTLKD